ncbi:H/ACA ribonucleoprotein complex non-core subunit NAF1-like [Euphorbia lathyris]|uniref:H/ACA ribonucleoprotein complex non-core subunit NAF1-like n=1 Tax=Euphorbia lathyris TaxID=212925 RepID=UPI0033132E1C
MVDELSRSVSVAASELMVKEAPMELEKEGNSGDLGVLDSTIEEELGRFSLVGSSVHSADGFVVKNDQILMEETSPVAPLSSVAPDEGDCGNDGSSSSSSGGDDDSSDSESSSSLSSSSSSSDDDTEEEEEEEDDDNEEKEVKMQLNAEEVGGEIEEGEIRDVVNREKMVCNSDEEESEDAEKMAEWSDAEFSDGGDVNEEDVVKGPIKSKNEVEVLPPVPPVDATLQPHHQMMPVGIVLSTLGAQVIVEGTEKHNPLNEGSVLWITEKRSPLGLVDEIFGPVQNPYYVVRYNSETEVPAEIHQGTLISFVAEFATHVLSEKNPYKKGYDASGQNDEELTDDGEFSDDEKEAEHKRMQKMSKRGMNQQTSNDTRRNNKNRNRNGNGNQKDSMPSGASQQPYNHNQQNQQPFNHNQQNASTAATPSMNSGASFFPPFPPMVPPNGIFQPPNGGWLNPLPSQQQNAAFIPGGFSGNNMPPWPAQNQPFQQPFNLNQGPVPNGVFPGGQMNLFPNGPSPWPAMAGQNCFNPSLLGMGFQMQQPNLPIMNFGQGMMCNQPQVQQNCNLQPPQAVPSGDIRPPQQFNSGASSGRGSRPCQRGGSRGRGRGRGRFSGGRGR